MKSILKKLLTILFCITIGNTIFAGGPNTWNGKGRIAISSDGNHHDSDDWSATAVTLMIFAKANMQDKVVLYTFSDHVWGNKNEEAAQEMRWSALEGKKIWQYNNATFIEAVAEPDRAYTAMRDAILASTP